MPIQKGPANLGTGVIETAELASNSVTTAKLATTLTVTHALGSASTPSITFTGDTNTGIFSPTADTIAFAEGGAEIARFDSSGNLFIGKTSDSDAAQGLSLYPSGSISYNDNNAGTRTAISYRRSGTQVGAITTTTSGVTLTGTNGITFTATQSASADANTLDDYEEGTWTTTIGGVANITGTPTLSEGRYTKIGRLVTLEGMFSAQTTSSNTNTYWTFTIPFNTSSNTSGACGSAKQENNFIVGAVSDTTSSSGNSAYVSYSASAQLPSGTATHSFSYAYTAAT
jgi:hypothetical protein